MKTLLLIAAMVALPVGVFFAGVAAMTAISGKIPIEGLEALNVRKQGYDRGYVEKYWGAIRGAQGQDGLDREMRLLKVDLLFPFLYGGALAVSLLIGWSLIGRPFSPVWCLLPSAVAMLADWLENLTQIRQLKLFMTSSPLSESAIGLASAATRIKLGALTLGAILVGLLLLWAVGVRIRRGTLDV